MSSDTLYAAALQRLLTVPSSPRLGLERMYGLLDALGNPHCAFKTIHVAGTNGKGSTALFISELLRTENRKIALTTSPHLCSARERIQINGEWVSQHNFIALEEKVYQATLALDDPPTFFERMVAMAFCYFAEQGVDVAVVEVGLGGRLDATNVVAPLVSVVTPVALDHQQFLGPDLTSIAKEKCGIIKPHGVVVSSPQTVEADDVLRTTVQARGAQWLAMDRDFSICSKDQADFTLKGSDFEFQIPALSMIGAHQQQNFAVAVQACLAAGFSLTALQVAEVARTGHWPGRCDVVSHEPLVVVDGAHNPAGVTSLARTLMGTEQWSGRTWCMIAGFARGHDPAEWARAWPPSFKPQMVLAVAPQMPRALPIADIHAGLKEGFKEVRACADLDEAMAIAQEALQPDGAVCVAGSLYLAGEALSKWREIPLDPQFPMF